MFREWNELEGDGDYELWSSYILGFMKSRQSHSLSLSLYIYIYIYIHI